MEYREVSVRGEQLSMDLKPTMAIKPYFIQVDDAQMIEFLLQFLEMFPELRDAPLFLAGESYGGKYVPALGIQIHRIKENHPINLRGLMIGSGLIDPHSMMFYSQLVSALGLMEDDEVDAVRILEETVVLLIDQGKMLDASNKFNETTEYIKKYSSVSVYNFNKDPAPIDRAPDFEAFINRPEIRMSIGRYYHFKKSGGNFVELLIRGAGHMVPGDQPEVTKTMVDQFINKYI